MLAAADAPAASRPDNTFIGPDLYNQLFTMHGTTMMFLFAVPVMQGLGIYFVPLMVGARSIAFPRLIAFSYWMYAVRRDLPVRVVPAERRTRRRLVRLSAAGGPAVHARASAPTSGRS